jgi:hypothetical protein
MAPAAAASRTPGRASWSAIRAAVSGSGGFAHPTSRRRRIHRGTNLEARRAPAAARRPVSPSRRFLCEDWLSRPSWRRSAPGCRRWSRWSARSEARTYDRDPTRGPVQTWYGPVDGGVGAPCVSWVLDERRVVGDNNRDWCPPWAGSAVASVLEGRPARMLAGPPVTGADRGGDPDVGVGGPGRRSRRVIRPALSRHRRQSLPTPISVDSERRTALSRARRAQVTMRR